MSELLTALRRYVHAYVNAHDFAVCRELMSDDYLLHMGPDDVRGRDSGYIPAVRHQYDQFPNLAYSIHDLLSDGEYAALHFSEHGAAVDRDHRMAAWTGVGIYRWDGGRFVECWAELDHHSRRRQLAAGEPALPQPVAIDPWIGQPGSPSNGARQAVIEWLASWRSLPQPSLNLDLGPHAIDALHLDVTSVEANVVFATEDRAAFHATVHGNYRGGIPGFNHGIDREVTTYIIAIVDIEAGQVTGGRGVSNRLAVQRLLRN